MNFVDLQLSNAVLRAVADAGYENPTPIQEQGIPVILTGRDVLGCAQTGTGKTASFTLPMIDILTAGRARARMPRSLILEPTRELAAQVAENFDTYGKYHKLSKALIIGGESMGDQIKVLERGADVLIATPGRLLDVFDRGRLLLNDVRILVIDEADRMLDMGFIPDVERIVSLVSRARQTMLFSATMPPAIRRLAEAFLSNPKEISVAPPATPAETVEQGLVVVTHAGQGGLREKRAALRKLIDCEDVRNALIFCNRKREVGVLHRSLSRHGYDAGLLHGDLAQSQRTEVLDRFRQGELRLLVCSDVAARGLDIEDMSHVFNFDVPTNPEDYVHRIGRTGRAGRSGRAFTIAIPEDGKYVALIEALIGRQIPRIVLEGIDEAELQIEPDRRSRRRDSRTGRARQSGRMERTAAKARADSAAAKPQGTAQEERAQVRHGRPPEKPEIVASRAGAMGNRRPHPRPARETVEKSIVGMGDHVPAFMLRDVSERKKA